MGKYEVFLKNKAIKDIKRIDKRHHSRIKLKIENLGENPLPADVKKLSDVKSMYRIRQGNYRIIYTVNFDEYIIRVLAVNHRKDSYRNL